MFGPPPNFRKVSRYQGCNYSEDKRAPCRHYLRGNCNKGNECHFKHAAPFPPVLNLQRLDEFKPRMAPYPLPLPKPVMEPDHQYSVRLEASMMKAVYTNRASTAEELLRVTLPTIIVKYPKTPTIHHEQEQSLLNAPEPPDLKLSRDDWGWLLGRVIKKSEFRPQPKSLPVGVVAKKVIPGLAIVGHPNIVPGDACDTWTAFSRANADYINRVRLGVRDSPCGPDKERLEWTKFDKWRGVNGDHCIKWGSDRPYSIVAWDDDLKMFVKKQTTEHVIWCMKQKEAAWWLERHPPFPKPVCDSDVLNPDWVHRVYHSPRKPFLSKEEAAARDLCASWYDRREVSVSDGRDPYIYRRRSLLELTPKVVPEPGTDVFWDSGPPNENGDLDEEHFRRRFPPMWFSSMPEFAIGKELRDEFDRLGGLKRHQMGDHFPWPEWDYNRFPLVYRGVKLKDNLRWVCKSFTDSYEVDVDDEDEEQDGVCEGRDFDLLEAFDNL